MMIKKMIEFRGIARAIDPVHQGGDRDGSSISPFNRMLTRVDGEVESLPVISANSVAGIMRRWAAAWMLDQIEFDKFSGRNALAAMDLLCSGGGRVVKSDKPGYIDLFEERQLREMFPCLSLFGGCIGNRMLRSRISVRDWVPLAQEYKSRLEQDLWLRAERFSIRQLLDEVSFSTFDVKKDRLWQDRIESDTLRAWQDDQGEGNEEKKKPISMRYGMEVLVPGTEFRVSFVLLNPSELDVGCFLGALSYFSMLPVVGGRTQRGFGRVEIDLHQLAIVRASQAETELALGAMETTTAHLLANREQIVRMIEAGL
jgi:hypothetical protein